MFILLLRHVSTSSTNTAWRYVLHVLASTVLSSSTLVLYNKTISRCCSAAVSSDAALQPHVCSAAYSGGGGEGRMPLSPHELGRGYCELP